MGTKIALNPREGMMRKRLIHTFYIFILSLPLTSSLFAADYLSCPDYEKIIHFVQREHLRFSVEHPGKLKELLEEAVAKVPEVLRYEGAYVLAAEFERYWAAKSKEPQTWLYLENLCQSLFHSRFREASLKALVSSLDPFSEFYNSQELERKTSVVDGHFVGVGVGTKAKDPYLEVVEVVEGGPSGELLRVGDLISHIDHRSVRGLSPFDLRQRIRGELHSKVVFTLLRDGQSMDVSIKRDHVFQKSMSHTWFDDSILQVKIHRFYAQTAPELKKLMESKAGKLKGLILDLRDNPGGLLQAARDVVDLFVSNGVVVHLKGAYEDQMWALGDDDFLDVPLVVLINEKTASASEIVAGALQDYGRAVLVGRETFGKSCVQNIYETQTALGTEYKGGLKLTTLWFYLPSGRSVQALSPDIQIASSTPQDTEKFKMPFAWPQQIDVIPFPKDDAKILHVFQKFKSRFQGLSESEEIGKALLRQLAVSQIDQ